MKFLIDNMCSEETIGCADARRRLSALINRVANGASITITRRGTPVAKLMPVGRRSRDAVLKDLKKFGKGRSLAGLTFRQLIDEGRRF
jgi:prevent-host-death family protein